MHSPSRVDVLDVAVVGGGISGVYAAWRLAAAQTHLAISTQKPGRPAIELFEADSRLGGRLYSHHMPVGDRLPDPNPLKPPSMPDSVVELGGMRFLPNQHRRVKRLVDAFKLESVEHPVEDPDRTNLYYLRGHRFSLGDWTDPKFSPPYALDRNERGRSPGSLMIEVALRHEKQLAVDPEPYRRRGFWNLLYDELSSEAYQLVHDAGGYETIVGNWNAADAIPFLLSDFHLAPGETYRKLKAGFMALPVAIHDAYKAAGGATSSGHRLVRLDYKDKLFELTFDFSGDPAKATGFDRPRAITGTAVTVRARHVILAMPRRAIELLHTDSVIFRRDDEEDIAFSDALKAVEAQPGFKIFAAYRRPWWLENNKITAGRSLTDLPVRQCFAWRTGKDEPSILMASYNDGRDVGFWKGLLRSGPVFQPRPEDCPPGIALPRHNRDGLAAPAALVEELHDQLRELHGATDAPGRGIPAIDKPYHVVHKDWTADPYGGGWHFWTIGRDSVRIRRLIRTPFRELNLHICGEAWSSQQGWVEGALETADEVLESFIKPGAPSPV